MNAIYKVTNTASHNEQLFTSIDKAIEYASFIMNHFGGEWEKSTEHQMKGVEVVFVSKELYHSPAMVSEFSIWVERVEADQMPLPRYDVTETYIDSKNRLIRRLARR